MVGKESRHTHTVRLPGFGAARAGFALFLTATVASILAACSDQATNETAAAPSVSGTWWTASYDPRITPLEGGELPFTAEGLATYQRNVEGLRSGEIWDDARRKCMPDGIPRILAAPYPFQILEVPGHVVIIYETNRVYRIITLDRTPPPLEAFISYPYYSGSSYGRWDGDTLVIETLGFNGKTLIDATGVPTSDQLRVTERYRKINNGQQLEASVTVEDPVVFSMPWNTRFVYESRPDIRIAFDYTCGEPHRELSAVEGADRW